jgi:hypothetical protein
VVEILVVHEEETGVLVQEPFPRAAQQTAQTVLHPEFLDVVAEAVYLGTRRIEDVDRILLQVLEEMVEERRLVVLVHVEVHLVEDRAAGPAVIHYRKSRRASVGVNQPSLLLPVVVRHEVKDRWGRTYFELI